MLGNKFSKILSNERLKRKLTIKEFANFLGIRCSTLFSWENGAIPRDFYKLRLISQKLQIPFYFIIFANMKMYKSVLNNNGK
jgi:transcriptional regulator with XRE-family HTH domain